MGRLLLIVGGLLILVSILLPIWGMTMIAPQYPDGLVVHVYPGRLEGDLSIINVLNHYVGMRPLEMDTFATLTLLPYVLSVIGGGFIVAGIFARRGIALSTMAMMVLSGIAGAFELRRNLIDFGTSLDPTAPLDMEPFVPPIIGHYEVWNFDISHAFMAGTYLLLIAFGCVVFGYRQLNRLDVRRTTSTSLLTIVLPAMLILAPVVGLPGNDRVHAESTGSLDRSDAPFELVVSSGISSELMRALSVVVDGGIVLVQRGVYEGAFIVERGVHLVAQGEAEIVFRGDGDVITIRDGGTVTGFTVRHGGDAIRSDDAAIRLFGSGGTVENNTVIIDTAHGIYIERGGHHVVSGNVIQGLPSRSIDDRGNGFFLFDTKGNVIRHNDIRHVRDGIYLSFAGEDIVFENEVSMSRYGIHSMFSGDILYEGNRLYTNVVGSAFMYSGNMELINNLIVDHSGHRGYGILLKDGNNNRLHQNYVVGNHLGLFADMSDENNIEGNIFAVNGIAMEIFASSERNRIVGNSFVGNGSDTLLNVGQHTTTWTDAKRGGNYWDTYRGIDIDGNGFGALPHTSGDPFGFITRNNPELRAFHLSPAINALEWAERAFPLMQTPKVRDDQPRVHVNQQALSTMHKQLAKYMFNRVSRRPWFLFGAVLLAAGGFVFISPLPCRFKKGGFYDKSGREAEEVESPCS